MVRDTEPASGWSLTHVRTGVCGRGDALDRALFTFGRDHTEMHIGDSLRLPTAVIEMIEEADLGDEAMEAGFVLEIRSKRPPPRRRGFWTELDLLFQHAGTNPFDVRGVYAPSARTSTAEMVCFCQTMRPLPQRVWMRVLAIPERTLAWLLDEGLLGRSSSFQTTLHEFCDLGVDSPTTEALPLPGPPLVPYGFLSD
jgi:hypothetical protein